MFGFCNPRKRQWKAAFEKSQCSVCKEIFNDAHKTPCNHVFCKNCITAAIQEIRSCPKCKKVLNSTTKLIPDEDAQKIADVDRIDYEVEDFVKSRGYEEMTHNIDNVLAHFLRIKPNIEAGEARKILFQRQHKLIRQQNDRKYALVLEFLDYLKTCRIAEATKSLIESKEAQKDYHNYLQKIINTNNEDIRPPHLNLILGPSPQMGDFNALRIPELTTEEILKPRDQLMMKHYDSMQQEYFKLKKKYNDYESNGIKYQGNYLDEFGDIATGICKYTSMSTIATMDYSRDGHGQNNLTNTPAVVSAIEFDKDGEYFVIAGIAHKMKLYDFDSVMDKPQTATPIAILPTTIKVSNVCWNPFSKPILATSYYNGSVQVWDCHTSRILHTYTEHEKRCWSIQFNSVNENIMASGSDDQKVKIWSLLHGNSIATIDAKVLVCCVHFNPAMETQLAFGGSDHCIYLYDMRNLRLPSKILRGHKKAVSYVKYIDSNHIVSASTDSTLRVWNIREDEAENVLEGHLNEKNFVGLATNGEHIVCGSESNEVFTYYKKCQRHVCKYDFTQDSTEDHLGLQVPRMCATESTTDFVSALCWKKESNIVMAANSQGKAQILQLSP